MIDCEGLWSEKDNGHAVQLVYNEKRVANVITFPHLGSRTLTEELGTIVHETSHIVDFILEWRSINDTETRAYLSDYIFKEIFGNL